MNHSYYGFQTGYDYQCAKLERLKAMGAPEAILQNQELTIDGITVIDADKDGWANLPVHGKNGALLPPKALSHRFFFSEGDLVPEDSLANALEMMAKLPEDYGFLVLSNLFCVPGVAGFLILPPETLGRNINETFAAVDDALEKLPAEMVCMPLGSQMLFSWGPFALWLPVKDTSRIKLFRKGRSFLKRNRRELIFDLLVVPRKHLSNLPAGQPYLLPEDQILWPTADEDDAA